KCAQPAHSGSVPQVEPHAPLSGFPLAMTPMASAATETRTTTMLSTIVVILSSREQVIGEAGDHGFAARRAGFDEQRRAAQRGGQAPALVGSHDQQRGGQGIGLHGGWREDGNREHAIVYGRLGARIDDVAEAMI